MYQLRRIYRNGKDEQNAVLLVVGHPYVGT